MINGKVLGRIHGKDGSARVERPPTGIIKPND
jgi:hypothetical protein